MYYEILLPEPYESKNYQLDHPHIGERVFLRDSGIWVIRDIIHLPERIYSKRQIVVSKPTPEENGNT